jgi:hypothetical protein
MLINRLNLNLIIFRIKKVKELKAPYRASAAATRDYVTTRDIVPTLAILLL